MAPRASNPFKPSAGHTPPILVGRDGVMEDFREALDDGSGAPGRLTCITGARGIGKTVILKEYEKEAQQRGWVTIRESAAPEMVHSIASKLLVTKGDISFRLSPSLNLVGFGASLGEISYAKQQHIPTSLFDLMSKMLDKLEKDNRGLLLTVDEAQMVQKKDMLTLATTMQQLTMDNRNIAFVFAGLPTINSQWLNNKALTFLRRAQPEKLGEVDLDEVSEAFAETFNSTHVEISGEPLDLATQATQGYPFMIQLVGYHIWRLAAKRSQNNRTEVTVDEAKQGIARALVRLGENVHGPELDGLSSVDRTFLLAMAQDDGPSLTSEIAKRMGKPPKYVSQYRIRLLIAQVIREAGYGKIDFAIPYLREYLREHAAYIRMLIQDE